MRNWFLFSAFLALLVTITACGSDKETSNTAAASSPTAAVEYTKDEPIPAGAEDARVIELDFTPETILPNTVNIKAGEKILFVIKNTDEDGEHNFLSSTADLPEILVYGGQTVRRLWTAPGEPGVHEPLCTLHPWIKMTFIVE